jgi:hypothetical protein
LSKQRGHLLSDRKQSRSIILDSIMVIKRHTHTRRRWPAWCAWTNGTAPEGVHVPGDRWISRRILTWWAGRPLVYTETGTSLRCHLLACWFPARDGGRGVGKPVPTALTFRLIHWHMAPHRPRAHVSNRFYAGTPCVRRAPSCECTAPIVRRVSASYAMLAFCSITQMPPHRKAPHVRAILFLADSVKVSPCPRAVPAYCMWPNIRLYERWGWFIILLDPFFRRNSKTHPSTFSQS